MTPWTSPSRAGRFTLLALAVTAGALVAVAAFDHIAVRTFALGAPNQFTLVTLTARHPVCEGPVRSPRAFDAISISGAATTPSAHLTLIARDSTTHRVLSSGPVTARRVQTEQRAPLSRPIGAGRTIQACVQLVDGGFSLTGSNALAPGVSMSGGPSGKQFSLLLLADANRSLFSSLDLAFSRAALFRPQWVGVWTYWALAIGMLLAVALAGAAILRAAVADADADADENGPRRPPA